MDHGVQHTFATAFINIVRPLINSPRNVMRQPASHHAFIKSGRFKGAILLPVVKAGFYVLSTSKHEDDYQLHPVTAPLEPMLASGYGMRM